MKDKNFPRSRRHQLPPDEREALKPSRVKSFLKDNRDFLDIYERDITSDPELIRARENFGLAFRTDVRESDGRTPIHPEPAKIEDILPPTSYNVRDISSAWDIHALERIADRAKSIGRTTAFEIEINKIPTVDSSVSVNVVHDIPGSDGHNQEQAS